MNDATVTVRLDGALSFGTVESWLARIELPRDGGKTVQFDLKGVTQTDSAGLALLLELRRRAHEAGVQSSFIGAPTQVAGIAGYFGLGGVLGLGTAR
jgi:phospholipid transport system transporter-binding protein